MNARSLKSFDNPLMWWICFSVGFAIVAARLPTDGNYDLENYHFYNGFAAFHERRALDIFPAQLQTTVFYAVDSIYYLIFKSLNDRPTIINILLSLPYSIAALTIFFIARLFAKRSFIAQPLQCGDRRLRSDRRRDILYLGDDTFEARSRSRNSDCLGPWLTLEKARRNTVWTAFGVGGLAGVSVGLKLTEASLFVGMALAIAARRIPAKGQRCWRRSHLPSPAWSCSLQLTAPGCGETPRPTGTRFFRT